MIRECQECGAEFDTLSPAKRQAGGLICNCPDCSDDAPRVIGLASGDGKGASMSIVRPASHDDRRKLLKYWYVASGMNKGKSCQLGAPTSDPGANFRTLYKHEATNHKGKM